MDKRKLFAIISVLLIAITLFSLTSCSRGMNYIKADLGKYIELSEEDYKSFDINIKFDEVTDADVDRTIMGLLYQHKDKEPQHNGGNVTNLPISIGDTVWLYYRGYTVDDKGVQNDIQNASNFFSQIQSLGIGSMSFISGFEEALIGKKPSDYKRFELRDSGKIAEEDVIYVTYGVMLPNGDARTVEKDRIDLSRDDLDSVYGNGFRDYFIGKDIGKKQETKIFDYGTGTAVYYDIKVEYATDCEKDPLVIKVHFPHNYKEPELRGQDAYFDVYLRYVNIYNTPEYNEKFIRETLKITDDSLEEYDGSTIVEKHRAYLKSEAIKKNESERRELSEEALWNHLADRVKIKKLPKDEVNEVYEEYYYEVTSLYESYYSSSYQTVADFAIAYLSITDGTDWLSYIQYKAERIVTERLMFYYIARAEGFLPDEETFDKLYAELTEEYLEYYADDIYKEELDKITNPEEKEKRLLEIKEEMLDYYGEEYFSEMVYYDYALDDILAFGQ